MKRRIIQIPFPSIVIREYSLFLSLLYFFALSNSALTEILGIACCFGVLTMLIPVIIDDDYSKGYKSIAVSLLLIALLLIIYNLFLSVDSVGLNRIIRIIGLCIICGGSSLACVVLLCLHKRIDFAQQGDELTQRLIEIGHMLTLHFVILLNM